MSNHSLAEVSFLTEIFFADESSLCTCVRPGADLHEIESIIKLRGRGRGEKKHRALLARAGKEQERVRRLGAATQCTTWPPLEAREQHACFFFASPCQQCRNFIEEAREASPSKETGNGRR